MNAKSEKSVTIPVLCVCAAAGLVVIPAVSSLIAGALVPGSGGADGGSGLIATLISDAAGLLMCLFVLAGVRPFKTDPAIPPVAGERSPDPRGIVLMTVLFILVLLFTGQTAAAIGSRTGGTESLFTANEGHPVIQFIVLIFLSPVYEELLTRGIVFRGLRGKCGFWLSAALSSALFAFWHPDVRQIVTGFFMGMIFALFYEVYRNILIPVVFHMINNLLAYPAISGYLNYKLPHGGGTGSGFESVMLPAVEILAAGYLYWKILYNVERGRR